MTDPKVSSSSLHAKWRQRCDRIVALLKDVIAAAEQSRANPTRGANLLMGLYSNARVEELLGDLDFEIDCFRRDVNNYLVEAGDEC